MLEEIYITGDYLKKNPTWHVEESPWKARQILRMFAQHPDIKPETICEVGCGVGEVLKQLQDNMDGDCVFWGYDIASKPLELARQKQNARLHFKLADFRQEQTDTFDLLLILDVIEHLEDYFSFLRDLQGRSVYKILHIPLDLSLQTIVRGDALPHVRDIYGHLHYFTKETALQLVRDAGYEVIDYFYTPRAVEIPSLELNRRLLKQPRRLLFAINQDWASRLLGGFSLLVLAK